MLDTGPPPPIQTAERQERARALFRRLPADVRAVVLFDDQFVQYLTGFVFAMTERPIAVLVLPDGERRLFVPRLEREHAEQTADVERVVDYPEYPGVRHPMDLLDDALAEAGAERGAVGVDHDGYPPVMGYAPRPLSGRWKVRRVSTDLDALMAIKSEHEIALIRESARWAGRAHRLMQDATRVGLSEPEVAGPASRTATQELSRRHGRRVPPPQPLGSGRAGAVPRSDRSPQRQPARPRRRRAVRRRRRAGHRGQCRRVGVPLRARAHHGDRDARSRGAAAVRPHAGVTGPGVRRDPRRPAGAQVDEALQAYLDRNGLREHGRHHVGHSLGQRIHESPFLDVGDPTVLAPGMVLSVEPGLYQPGLGGFRHSDTVLVTEDGIEMLTDYPRDLASLTLPDG